MLKFPFYDLAVLSFLKLSFLKVTVIFFFLALLEVVSAVIFNMQKSNLHSLFNWLQEKVVCDEDTEPGPGPSKGLMPVVQKQASGVFLKIFLISKYAASWCETVVECYWKQSSVPLGWVWQKERVCCDEQLWLCFGSRT